MSTCTAELPPDLMTVLERKVVGQPKALEMITPYVQMYQAGLAPPGRPVGNFLMLGPTGTGKTRTVEVLAEALHGNPGSYLKIDCGEYQMEHEIAKLIGAPPGYLGHRETVPVLSAKRLNETLSPNCDISLVLFDEIEKAAPSLTRLLLGVLDKAVLKLGDNTSVNFERSLIFLTSNLGAADMMREMRPVFGFDARVEQDRDELESKLEAIAMGAVRKQFAPEFVNRIDAVVTYNPLRADSLARILDHQLDDLQSHVASRLGAQGFGIQLTASAREFLLNRGTSTEYGARELKRVIHRSLMQPLAAMVVSQQVPGGSRVVVDAGDGAERLSLSVAGHGEPPSPARPRVLIVEDESGLLKFLRHEFEAANWDVITADSAEHALPAMAGRCPDLALVDHRLPRGSGLELSDRLRERSRSVRVILMTGGLLTPDEQQQCSRGGYTLVKKPFRMSDLMNLVRGRSGNHAAHAGA